MDLQQRIIRVRSEETKAKRLLDLPMSTFVRDLLVARRSIGDTKFVFPGARGPMAAPRREQIKAKTGADVSPHDLRRTFCTVAGRTAGVNPFQIKCLVNHSLGQFGHNCGLRPVFTTEDLREPAQKICDRLKVLCGVEDDPTVARIA